MRTAHTWNVQVQSGAPGNEVTTEKVQGHWDPEHALTTESVMTSGEFNVKARNKFKYNATALPDTVELVEATA